MILDLYSFGLFSLFFNMPEYAEVCFKVFDNFALDDLESLARVALLLGYLW